MELEKVYECLEFDRVLSFIADEAVSEAGKKRVKEIRPFTNPVEVYSTQDKIRAVMSIIESGKSFPLSTFEDVRREIIKGKVEESYYDIRTLNEIRNILGICGDIKSFWRDNKSVLKPLHFMLGQLDPLYSVASKINRVIGKDLTIVSSASSKLSQIRAEMKQLVELMHTKIERIMKEAAEEGWLQEENPTIRDGRLVVPLRTEFKRKVKGIIHGQSATGQTTYVEPIEIVDINNRLMELEEEEKEEIRRILKNLTRMVRPHIEVLLDNISILVELDCINACARYAVKNGFSVPTVKEGDRAFRLLGAKHPVLMCLKEVVPLDFSVSRNVEAVIITGPNAGGKTVAMKTVGLLVLMAMCGLPIPAEGEVQVPFFDDFLVDIGDQQSIEDDLSTFTSHMKNLKEFVENADEKSLVLIDELGTGTDPVEGAALGRAIVEKLIEKGAFTIVTTHHNALKSFAQENPKVINAGMEFSPDELVPTYRLRIGVPGNSYALEISSRLGVPEDIIARAREYIGKGAIEYERALLEVERLRRKLEIEKGEVENAKKTLDKIVEDYQKRLDRIKEKEKKFEKELSLRLKRIVDDYRRQIERVIKEIREKEASKAVIKKAHRVLENVEKELDARREENIKVVSKQVSPGSFVRIKELDLVGKVENLNDRSGKASVIVGGKTLKVGIEEVEPVEVGEEAEASVVSTGGYSYQISDEGGSTILNIRGKRVDEAEEEVFKFIDRAILKGLRRVEIVHGKGTGALQRMVWNLLKDINGVKNYYFDDFDRGGTGVTIVELE